MLIQFIEYLQSLGLAERTIDNYVRRIERFLLSGKQDPAEFIKIHAGSASDTNQWAAALNHYASMLANRPGGTRPYAPVKSKSTNRRLPKPLTKEEINALCATIPVERPDHRAIIEFLYCGLRNQECCSLTLNDIDGSSVRVIGKGSKERIVPITDTAKTFFVSYLCARFPVELSEVFEKFGHDAVLKTAGKLWPTEPAFLTETGLCIYPRMVRDVVYRYAKLADVQNAHPHRLRHSFATHTLDEGLGNLIALKDVLGHASFEMVDKYVLTSSRGRDLVRGFHPRQRENHKAT